MSLLWIKNCIDNTIYVSWEGYYPILEKITGYWLRIFTLKVDPGPSFWVTSSHFTFLVLIGKNADTRTVLYKLELNLRSSCLSLPEWHDHRFKWTSLAIMGVLLSLLYSKITCMIKLYIINHLFSFQENFYFYSVRMHGPVRKLLESSCFI